MSIWIECEQCDQRLPAFGADPVDKSVFFRIETVDRSEVGHYCCAAHAHEGIVNWINAMSEPDPDDA